MISFDSSWVDPYDAGHHGIWALTATIVRDDNGEFIVHSIEETSPAENNEIDE